MTWRIAINGYGRIGQSILRALYQSDAHAQCKVVAINELADIETISYLTKYDTTHGKFRETVTFNDSTLKINDDEITISHHKNLEDLSWSDLDVDIVFECTGVYKTREHAQRHIDAGAKRVLFSHPSVASVDRTIVYGQNHKSMRAEDTIVSNASCTTNAIVPVLKLVDEHFGIQSGAMTTIHSAMNDQPTIDAYHHKDLRRTRSAMANMVPVETELAKGVERILPEFIGRLSAVAMRVPTTNVSAIDLTVMLDKETTAQDVNRVLMQSALHSLPGILGYTEEPIASSDFIQDEHSCTVDGSQTRVTQGRLLKLLVWFDNEWGFANRMLDVANYWCHLDTTSTN